MELGGGSETTRQREAASDAFTAQVAKEGAGIDADTAGDLADFLEGDVVWKHGRMVRLLRRMVNDESNQRMSQPHSI